MDIEFKCQNCGQSLTVEERGAGMAINCPACKRQITIPTGSQSSAGFKKLRPATSVSPPPPTGVSSSCGRLMQQLPKGVSKSKSKKFLVFPWSGAAPMELTAEEVIAKCKERKLITSHAIIEETRILGLWPVFRPIREFPEFAPHVWDATLAEAKRNFAFANYAHTGGWDTTLAEAERNPRPDAECYLLISGEQKGPFLPAQILSMWNSGTITADTLYKHADLPEWRPVKAFCQNPAWAGRGTSESEMLKRVVEEQRNTSSIARGILFFLIFFVAIPVLISQCGK